MGRGVTKWELNRDDQCSGVDLTAACTRMPHGYLIAADAAVCQFEPGTLVARGADCRSFVMTQGVS